MNNSCAILFSILLALGIVIVIILCCTKESYHSAYQYLANAGKQQPLSYHNGYAPKLCTICKQPNEAMELGCLCSDMTEPFRTRYPIDLPSPFGPYDLPNQICPKCFETLKTKLA